MAKGKKQKKNSGSGKQKMNKTVALVIAIVLVITATVGILVPTVIIPTMKYNEALAFLEKDKFDEASEILAALEDFRDSKEKLDSISLEKYKYALRLLEEGDNGRALLALQDASKTVIRTDEVNEIKYKFAVRLTELNEYVMAAKLFDSLGQYKDSNIQLQLVFQKQLYSNVLSSGIYFGSEVVFGTYEQDGNTENGGEAIEWFVLAQEDDSLVLISKYALKKMPFADTKENFRWDKSSVRSWLNADFYDSAFDAREKSMILTSEVTGEVDPSVGTSLDFSVNDKVYLFSSIDIAKYFVSDLANVAYATAYATGDDVTTCEWWLREHYGAYVNYDGSLMHSLNNGFVNDSRYVRPVIRISINENMVN